MFKSEIQILNTNWVKIDSFKSRFKPAIGELIYSYQYLCYYKVILVVHTIGKFITNDSLLVIVEKASESLKLTDKLIEIEGLEKKIENN